MQRCLVGLALVALATLGGAAPARAQGAPGTQRGTFYSNAMRRQIPYYIYLPPDYKKSGKTYPVVYWLHGLTETERTGVGLTQYLHRAILAGKIQPMVLVFGTDGVNAFSFYRDNPSRNRWGETVILRELLPHIEKTYRVRTDPGGRALEGFSMGGLGCATFAVKYPDLFSSYVSVAGAHSDPGVYQMYQDRANKIRGRFGIWLIVGTADVTLGYNRRFHAVLQGADIPHDYQELNGIIHLHPELYYQRLGISTLAFHARWFK